MPELSIQIFYISIYKMIEMRYIDRKKNRPVCCTVRLCYAYNVSARCL